QRRKHGPQTAARTYMSSRRQERQRREERTSDSFAHANPVPVSENRAVLPRRRKRHRKCRRFRSFNAASDHGVTSDSRSTSRKVGNIRYHTATITSVPTPPITTAGTVPNHVAVTPDSNAPSSFDAPTNSLFTALTRPRIPSGVASCVNVVRTYTLTMSDAPSTNSAAIESVKFVDKPNTIVAIP